MALVDGYQLNPNRGFAACTFCGWQAPPGALIVKGGRVIQWTNLTRWCWSCFDDRIGADALGSDHELADGAKSAWENLHPASPYYDEMAVIEFYEEMFAK